MKIHLIASRPTLEQDVALLRKIVVIIHENRHELAREWIEGAYDNFTKHGHVSNDWSTIFKKSLEAIAGADLVIAETSHENFGVGYMVSYAVQNKKPILLLRRDGASDDAFARGVEDGWVKHESYTDETVGNIVKKFIDDNDIKSKDMRFNFFLDRKIYNYLRWASFKTGKTKAEILRELVQQEIDKKGSLD